MRTFIACRPKIILYPKIFSKQKQIHLLLSVSIVNYTDGKVRCSSFNFYISEGEKLKYNFVVISKKEGCLRALIAVYMKVGVPFLLHLVYFYFIV